jgi:hypothetical protein
VTTKCIQLLKKERALRHLRNIAFIRTSEPGRVVIRKSYSGMIGHVDRTNANNSANGNVAA